MRRHFIDDENASSKEIRRFAGEVFYKRLVYEMAVESASYEAVIARYSCIYDVMNKIELTFAKQIRRFDINNEMISLPDEIRSFIAPRHFMVRRWSM